MPDLFNLLHDMIEEDPAMRPSFEEALATLKEIRAATSAELLAEPVEEGFCDPWASHISPEK